MNKQTKTVLFRKKKLDGQDKKKKQFKKELDTE